MGSGNFHGLVLRQDAIVVAEIQSSCCLLFVRICNPHILSIGIFNPAISPITSNAYCQYVSHSDAV